MSAFVRMPGIHWGLHRVLLPAVSVALILCSGVAADSGVSPKNVTIDTRIFLAGEVIVTMHRVGGVLLENGGAGTPIDEPLRVHPNVRTNLAACPELPLLNLGLPADSGLVADGVTPLLFRVAANSSLTGPVNYDVSLAVDKTKAGFKGDLHGKLKVLSGGAWVSTRRFTLTPSTPDAYLMLEPVNSSDIEENAGGMANVIMTIRNENASSFTFPASQNAFGIRKPPVVLVHGYNTDDRSWSADFKNVLGNDRGDDFVISVSYGLDEDSAGVSENTRRNIDDLAGVLDAELERQVERGGAGAKWASTQKWAFTRYDAVGHSQGGVLLRLLCSQPDPQNPGVSALKFRNDDNHNRGRFHRVITVGSPHFGSTLAHLGRLIFDSGTPFLESVFQRWMLKNKRSVLLQRKFMIDEGVGGSPTPRKLHELFIPDPSARIHLLGSTIFGGATSGADVIPSVYMMLYFPWNPAWGELLAPHGSDGVVDLRSQLAGTQGSLFHANPAKASRIPATENVAHADIPGWGIPDMEGFLTTRNQTADESVAAAVRDLLNGENSAFGPFPTFDQCGPIYDEMQQVANATHGILDQIRSSLSLPGACFMVKSDAAPLKLAASAVPGAAFADAIETLELSLQGPESEPQAEPAQWSAVVYGPDGVSTQGLTLVTSGALSETLRIEVAASVIGEVVVSVSYLSTTGRSVIGSPGVVFTRFPGLMTGLALKPDAVALPAGPTVQLETWGLYDAGSSTLLFTDALNMTYTSAAPAIASVDDRGQVSLLTPGSTTISAIYSGTCTGTISVLVIAPPPILTSTGAVQSAVSEPFAYQIAASGLPVSYIAENLPAELSLDAATGLIEGIPSTEGRFAFTVGAVNADGQIGRLPVTLTVTGDNQPPADIGLDTESVPALQPAGSVVGLLATVDGNTLDTHTYALVAGSGDTDNALFAVDGNILRTAAIIDPSVTPFCSIRLRTTDSAGLSFEKELVLPVAGAPVILEEPVDALVFAGREFALAVKASGREPLSFQWQADGADLPGEHGVELLHTYGEPGTNTFRVLVSNALGVVTSTVAVVIVEPLSFTYAVTYNANGATSGTAPASQAKTNDVALTLQTNSGNLIRTGHTFAGWNTATDGTGTTYAAGSSYTANADVTLYAKWTANTYTITFDRQSGSGGSSSVTATYGAAMPAATAPSRTGYTFQGYFDQTNGNGTRYYNANMSSASNWDKPQNTTLYAHWTSSGAWDDSYQDLGGGWRRVSWFGDYVPTGSGWFWHNRHGYFFPTSASVPSSIYIYTMDMGWLFTRSTLYPYLYRFSNQNWLWYLPDSHSPRWFNNLTTGQWESRP